MAKKKTSTEDIKPGWLNPIRAAQAVCKSNNGYGIVHLTVLVSKNEPVSWLEPSLKKIHPAALASLEGAAFSPTLLSLLVSLTKEVDNKESGTVE
jgi:hypothetical protein